MTAVPYFPQTLPADSADYRLLEKLGERLAADRGMLNRNDAYFRGEHPLAFMQPLIQEKLDDRILPMIANFCELIVETYEARLDVEGFDYPAPADGPSPEDLWEVWRASDMDEGAPMAHTDALALSRSYAVVGDGESRDDPPLITVESALQMADIRDARTRRVKAAGKFWTEPGDRPSQDTLWSALWTPDRDATFRRTTAGWVEDWHHDHGRGAVSVEPLVCKPRMLDKSGRSIFESLLPMSDGLNKTLSDMMTSMEFHAIPRRWATGLSEQDFKDEHGNDRSVFKLMADQVWAVSSKEAQFGQFTEADLKNFHDSAKLLNKMIGMLVALPGHT
ncbi:MAG: phage portal protein, partial [Kocuria sp.]|nr:phage portal protein [Kocuria sp.]